LEWWIGLKQARSSWGFQQFLYFAFLCDFIKSQHFKQRILILVKLENVLQNQKPSPETVIFLFTVHLQTPPSHAKFAGPKNLLFTRHHDANFIQIVFFSCLLAITGDALMHILGMSPLHTHPKHGP
jgi:hypothetical protein